MSSAVRQTPLTATLLPVPSSFEAFSAAIVMRRFSGAGRGGLDAHEHHDKIKRPRKRTPKNSAPESCGRASTRAACPIHSHSYGDRKNRRDRARSRVRGVGGALDNSMQETKTPARAALVKRQQGALSARRISPGKFVQRLNLPSTGMRGSRQQGEMLLGEPWASS